MKKREEAVQEPEVEKKPQGMTKLGCLFFFTLLEVVACSIVLFICRGCS